MRDRFAPAGEGRFEEAGLNRFLHVEDMRGMFKYGNAPKVEGAEVVNQYVLWIALNEVEAIKPPSGLEHVLQYQRIVRWQYGAVAITGLIILPRGRQPARQ